MNTWYTMLHAANRLIVVSECFLMYVECASRDTVSVYIRTGCVIEESPTAASCDENNPHKFNQKKSSKNLTAKHHGIYHVI